MHIILPGTQTSRQTDFAANLQFILTNMVLTDVLFAIIFTGPCLEAFFFHILTLYSNVGFFSISLFEELLKMKSSVKCEALTLLTLQTNNVKVMKS